MTYAYIREPSGKTRKMRAMPGWRVGDHLQKRKGEMEIRKLRHHGAGGKVDVMAESARLWPWRGRQTDAQTPRMAGSGQGAPR